MTTIARARFASAVDTARYGPYRIDRTDPRPLYRFTGRLSADGTSGFPAEPDRYHLYVGWFCPWSQRVTLELALNGLTGIIGVSYVDGSRDGRGWAFREDSGPDTANGFALLREAYEATEPGFDGHISIPTLWDTRTGRVVSNDYRTLGLDIATQFGGFRTPGVDTYPVEHRTEIEELDDWIGPAVNHGVGTASGSGVDADRARADLLAAFDRLDDLLTDRIFLVGRGVTEADIRLWVTLARYDVQATAAGRIGPALSQWPNLARYAGWLAELPAFRATTRWEAFAEPGVHTTIGIHTGAGQGR
jgi:putative glutathione S-transferase